MVNLYNMTLHEELGLDSTISGVSEIKILRVPGGWIYSMISWDYATDQVSEISSVFVPFTNEYQ